MSTAQDAYLHTRISLYAGQLLGLDRIDALIDRPYDDDTRNAVQTKATGSPVEQYTGDLDQHNVTILLNELAVLIRPLTGAARELLGYWAHRFELGNLKTIIRGKMSKQPRAAIEGQLQDMGHSPACPSPSSCKATRLRNCCAVWNRRPTPRLHARHAICWNREKLCSRSMPRWIGAILRDWRGAVRR